MISNINKTTIIRKQYFINNNEKCSQKLSFYKCLDEILLASGYEKQDKKYCQITGQSLVTPEKRSLCITNVF